MKRRKNANNSACGQRGSPHLRELNECTKYEQHECRYDPSCFIVTTGAMGVKVVSAFPYTQKSRWPLWLLRMLDLVVLSGG